MAEFSKSDYRDWVIQRANELRMNPTKSEIDFLDWVKKHYYSVPLSQYPIEVNGKWFILDFFFGKLNIAIEIDGGIHNKQIEKDKVRDRLLFDYRDIYTIRIDNRFCNPKVLDDRFESKISYATSVLRKYGKDTGVLKKKKTVRNNK